MKARRIASQIRNRPYKEAITILTFLPHKSSCILLKALKSAVSNFKQIFSYDDSNLLSLIITEVRVDNAPFLKRLCPHAQGRAFPIKKHFSHITSAV